MDTRQQRLIAWLRRFLGDFRIEPVVGDASFRRYFRISLPEVSYVAMDAPPHLEDCHSYLAVDKIFNAQGLHVPEIFQADCDNGFLLLEDLGDLVYVKVLSQQNADELYRRALEKLVIIQRCQGNSDWRFPEFNEKVLWGELLNFEQWFLGKHLNIYLEDKTQQWLHGIFQRLIATAMQQPTVCIHRDYHSRNLMVLPEAVGILDFQDAALGPITYDLVSLIRDCYIEWSAEQVMDWCKYFYKLLNRVDFSLEQFSYWFDLMGMQRHLKAIFIFARKHHRDNNSNYLPDIARGLRYLLAVASQYPEFDAFYEFLQHQVLPRYETVSLETMG